MTFTMLTPIRTRNNVYMGDKVRLYFPQIKGKTVLMLYFGADLAKRVGIKEGDSIGLGLNDSNPLVWMLKKSDNGWKIVNINSKRPNSPPLYRLQIAWPYEIPAGMGSEPRFATGVDIYEGGIRIFLPGTTIEDRSLS